VEPQTYICRLSTANSAPPPEIRVKAESYEEAIDKAIRAFRNDPDFSPPAVRVKIHAYQLTRNGINEEDSGFRYILPDVWQ